MDSFFTPEVYYSLLATDYFQTRTIVENPDVWHEQNMILGRHPSIADVNKYFAASALLSAAILKYAPKSVQKVFLKGGTIVELGAVGNNIKLGIRLSF